MKSEVIVILQNNFFRGLTFMFLAVLKCEDIRQLTKKISDVHGQKHPNKHLAGYLIINCVH